MFLKQIEVIGFKSFANKTTIDFVPGVTAVVGPNGSGKSNISDAIRWVLGEQSARSLRGAKMEDIIFAGSDSKKALNMAEVTLVLDNTDHYMSYDYSEISVTRRVFRSGDSDFLLNGKTCRLKDIVELFMDSGLGREAYSIISQGKIDDILNSKAEDKRKIFEEAAGVFKYKTRKIAAEKKLQEADENLQRVEDIRYELETQIEPLAEQASLAKEYLEKKDELEQIEVAILAHDIEATHENWEAQTQKVEGLKEEELKLSTQIQTKEAEYEEMLVHLQALDQSIEELQESLLLSSERVEKLEGERNVLLERQKHVKASREELDTRRKTYEEQIIGYEESLREEREKYERESNQLLQLKEKMNQTAHEFDQVNQDLDVQIEALKGDYFELLNQQAAIRNEIRYLNEQEVQLDKRRERLETERADQHTLLAEWVERKESTGKKLKTITENLRKAREAYSQLKNEIVELETQLEKEKAAYNKAGQLIQQAKSRKDMLEEMSLDYSGFFQGVKQVLKARENKLSGIEGAVAELLKVNKKYEVAVETALGGSLQHIVVETERDAREAIAFLKKTQSGRATFLPLSVIRPRTMNERDRIAGHPAFLGTGDELVTCEVKYKKVLQQLLGAIVVASDLKGANELARALDQRYRVVTLEGDVISPGGAMTGGTQKQKSVNLLGRKREIDQLTIQIQQMEVQHQELEQTITQKQQVLNEKMRNMEQLRDQGQQLQLEEREVEGELKEITIEMNNVHGRVDIQEREKQDIHSEWEKISQRLKSLKEGQAENEIKEKELNQEIEWLTGQKEHQEISKQALQESLTELKVQVAEQQQKVQYQEEAKNRIEKEHAKIAQSLKETIQSIQLSDAATQAEQGNYEALEQEVKTARMDKDAITQWIRKRREMRLDLHTKLEFEERSLKEEKRLHKGIAEAFRMEELKLSRLDMTLDNLLNQLSEEYTLTFEAAKANYPLDNEPEAARTQVKLIKREIEELGNVNLGSIEEYDRVSTRYTFLTNQREDLLKAKATLNNVIYEMDQEVEKRFSETFYKIQEQFQIIFKELFGGGKADLCLTDPEDILETGVDILAQPPGKKLQHLSLLSGGERALTAIALLFAILKVRPVPFCVLDEVEAALDDANVFRYASFLKSFSRDTQFIVVTHRKGTMEQADVLYGVTMQESGVSNLVSVRLEESKELVEAN